ncbi:MAG: hypothetical protein FJ087_17970 [Deltaproteobacteria bacterium]|nr:hypothetical protein [Deltaproteobacteria bacterium]
MRIHVLVEGSSEKKLLDVWLPRFLPGHTFVVHPHRGKGHLPADPTRPPDPKRLGLLDQLPAKLRAFGKSLDPAIERVLVLVDQDDDACKELKGRLVSAAAACDPAPIALFRIAVEETEAFYLGDPGAIRRAFPGSRLHKLRDYVQDSACGTWEKFRDVIAAPTEDKVAWAEIIAPHLGTEWQGHRANRSPSFRSLCTGLRRLAGEPA